MKIPIHGDISSVGHDSILASELSAMSLFQLFLLKSPLGLSPKGLLCADVEQVVQEQLTGALGWRREAWETEGKAATWCGV